MNKKDQLLAELLLGEFAELEAEAARLAGLAKLASPSSPTRWQDGVLYDPEDDPSTYASQPFLAAARSSVCPVTGRRCCKPECSANCIDFILTIDQL